LRETNPVQIEKIKEEYLPLEVLMRQTREAVSLKGRVSLADLVHMDASRSRLIGIFLAVLELIKLGGLVALQDKEFGEILLLDPDNLSSLLAA
jgi:segregation and condensation protein A